SRELSLDLTTLFTASPIKLIGHHRHHLSTKAAATSAPVVVAGAGSGKLQASSSVATHSARGARRETGALPRAGFNHPRLAAGCHRVTSLVPFPAPAVGSKAGSGFDSVRAASLVVFDHRAAFALPRRTFS
ncbi:hypothetical protein Drorol1_Dr00026485, partial [Drosera rotundifolia]